MSERAGNLLLSILVVCAVVSTCLVIRREFFSNVSAPVARVTTLDRWSEYADSGHRFGPADAPVRVVIFSDFQCPACAVAASHLRALRVRYPNEIALYYRHFPLPSHAHAIAAARASECAAAQDRFEPYHDALFADQRSIGQRHWTSYAVAAGVPDTAAFRRCAADQAGVPALARDMVAGERLGVEATPTILINQFRIRGVFPLDSMSVYIDRALAERRAESRRAERRDEG